MADHAAAAAKMKQYLEFVLDKAKDPNSIPRVIKGRVMEHVDCNITYHAVQADGMDVWLRAGNDPHSCTATAAALAHWLSPPEGGIPRTLSAFDPQMCPLMRPLMHASEALHASGGKPTLLVFHTAPHKFAVLCCGGRAALLHSNQDDTGGGRKFTLLEHLDGESNTQLHMTVDEATRMCSELARAAGDTDKHEQVFNKHFGAPFVKGHPDDYWFVALPAKLPSPTSS